MSPDDELLVLKARIERAELILLNSLGRPVYRVIDEALLVLRGQK